MNRWTDGWVNVSIDDSLMDETIYRWMEIQTDRWSGE